MWQDYWCQFNKCNAEGVSKGDGIAFEQLIEALLQAKYGRQWHCTKQSHDNNRDFWLYYNDEHIWAECKNYLATIAMNILAPTLVMAQVYDVNTILFFSRSSINESSKNKILAFGEKTGKKIFFYDGYILEQFIWNLRDKLPTKYKPLIGCKPGQEISPNACLYFSQDPILGICEIDNRYIDYASAFCVRYNETFGISFLVKNPLPDSNIDIKILFSEDAGDRFCFEYLDNRVLSEDSMCFQRDLSAGEGFSFSMNMRPIIFKPQLILPGFEVIAYAHNNEIFRKKFPPVKVTCHWVGETKLIGNNYWQTINEVENKLTGNSQLSCLALSGGSGTGKSRMLYECINIFLKYGYTILNLSASTDFSSYNYLKEVIAFLYEIPDYKIIDCLEQRFVAGSNSDIDNNAVEQPFAIKLIKEIDSVKDENSLVQFINKYGEIIFEKLSLQRCVLVVDNVQYVGNAFLHFLKKYIKHGINRNRPTYCALLFVFNLDFMTNITSEFLFDLIHSGIKHIHSKRLIGFETVQVGQLFLRELIHTRNEYFDSLFEVIIDKLSLNPYHLYQTVRYLEENNIVKTTVDGQGYIIESDKAWKAISNLSNGITEVLDKRWLFLVDLISEELLNRICSVLFLFEKINSDLMNIFKLSVLDLKTLKQRHFLKLYEDNIYTFEHDIIRNYFTTEKRDHLLDSLKWLRENKKSDAIIGYPFIYDIYKIAIEQNEVHTINILKNLESICIPPKLGYIYYDCLFTNTLTLAVAIKNHTLWIEFLNTICKQIRKYKGSVVALDYYERANAVITTSIGPLAYSKNICAYRSFLHFYCDILLQLHRQDEVRMLAHIAINESKKSKPTERICTDENLVLQAIMYNRCYVSYNNDYPSQQVQLERTRLMKKSRSLIKKIKSYKRQNLISYLNNSDEGYNYYGYQKNKEQLMKVWEACLHDMPRAAPEKTLNYYRKLIQIDLINKDFNGVLKHLKQGRNYLKEGKFSHEPLIFNTFFLMAECMMYLQNRPIKAVDYVDRLLSELTQIQQILQNGKMGDIMLLKGVNAFYAGDADGVYFAFNTAYVEYLKKKTSRYWIKQDLLLENIQYAFSVLDIYSKHYDCLFLPIQFRVPLTNTQIISHTASGIQQTKDHLFNLPLI